MLDTSLKARPRRVAPLHCDCRVALARNRPHALADLRLAIGLVLGLSFERGHQACSSARSAQPALALLPPRSVRSLGRLAMSSGAAAAVLAGQRRGRSGEGSGGQRRGRNDEGSGGSGVRGSDEGGR